MDEILGPLDDILEPLFDDLDYLAGQPLYPPGTMIGEFRIVRHLGRGAFGEVYEAENTAYGRFVALKFGLDLGSSSRPSPGATALDATAPLRNDIRWAVSLNLPNFINVYALRSDRPTIDGEVGDAVSFIEMELAAGRTLADWVGRLSLRQIVAWVVPVAESLHAAHELGDLIHCDVKPHNILLVYPRPGAKFEDLNPETLVPKAADFGLARRMGADGAGHGTPEFAPPEQWDETLDVLRDDRPRRAAAIDGFALAATIYSMVNLVPNRDRHDRPILGQDKRPTLRPCGPGPKGNEPYSLPNPRPLIAAGADADLVAVLLKQLDPDPRRRYPTVREFATDLRGWLKGEAVAARNFRGATWKGFQKQSRAVRYGVPALVAALIALGVALGMDAVGSARNAAKAAEAGEEQAKAERNAAEDREARLKVEATTARVIAGLHADAAKKDQDVVRDLLDQSEAITPLLTSVEGQKTLDRVRHRLSEIAAAAERELARAGEAADLYRRAGRLAFNLGDVRQAAIDYDASRRLAEGALQAEDTPANRHRLAIILREWGVTRASRCPVILGQIVDADGKVTEAKLAWNRAFQLLEPLASTGPEYRFTLAQLHMVRANVGSTPAEKREQFGMAERLVEELLHETPGDRKYLFTLAEILNNREYLAGGNVVEQEKHCRRAIAIRRELTAGEPDSAKQRAYLAASLNHLGNVLQKQGPDRADEAKDTYLEAKTIYEALIHAFPGVKSNRDELKDVEENLRNLASSRGAEAADPR